MAADVYADLYKEFYIFFNYKLHSFCYSYFWLINGKVIHL